MIPPAVPRTLRGPDCLKKLPLLLDKLQIRKPLIVGGKGLTARLLRAVPQLLSSPVFSAYHPNPDLADAVAGADLYRQQACDGLISIGGGSCMDTAKSIQAMLCADSMEDVLNSRLRTDRPIPHIAVPGTAGSGSEATQTAVVYVDHRKVSLNHPLLLPTGVALDSSLLQSLPDYHRKSCALDALCQGIESFWCASANDESRVHAYLAILGVLDNLRAYLAGDPHAAQEMLEASYESGKAIQITRTTAAHAMSYQLTQTFGIAHGHACMLTLPELWERMNRAGDMKPVLNHLSEIMRLGNPLMGPRLLKGILYDLEMEIPMIQDEETLDRLVDSVNPERLGNHPVALSRDDLRWIYRVSLRKPTDAERQTCLDVWQYYGR